MTDEDAHAKPPASQPSPGSEPSPHTETPPPSERSAAPSEQSEPSAEPSEPIEPTELSAKTSEHADEPSEPSVKSSGEAAVAKTVPDYRFFTIVSMAWLAADLGTKWWAKSTLENADAFGDRRIEVINGLLSFIYARNKGGAWGILSDDQARPLFILFSFAAIAFILWLHRKLTPDQIALKWSLPLVLGGALGNLIDRIRYGHVVDFIDVTVSIPGMKHWPTFNIADVAICLGVGLMAIDMFTPRKKPKVAAADDALKADVEPHV